MKPDNIQYLKDHRDCWTEIQKAETAKKANAIKGDLHRIMMEEFYPNYVFIDGCGDCLFVLVRLLYEKFDEYQMRVASTVIQIDDTAMKVAANFPKHNKRR